MNCSRYQNTLSSCLTEGPIAIDAQNLLDWRFFYALEGVGKSTCGIARRAGGRFLRQFRNAGDFLTPHWQNSLRLAGSNPSVLGFFTEQMVLSWVWDKGCPSWDQNLLSHPKPFVSTVRNHKLSVGQDYSFKYPPHSISGQSTPLWYH